MIKGCIEIMKFDGLHNSSTKRINLLHYTLCRTNFIDIFCTKKNDTCIKIYL